MEEGICNFPGCKKPILIINAKGKVPMFCAECKKKIQDKTKRAMEKRGQKIGNKRVVFVDER